jgi:hypothetical protein
MTGLDDLMILLSYLLNNKIVVLPVDVQDAIARLQERQKLNLPFDKKYKWETS